MAWRDEHRQVMAFKNIEAKEQTNKRIMQSCPNFWPRNRYPTQCEGGHLGDLNQRQTIRNRYEEWCRDIDNFFHTEKELDFISYHAWFENTSKYGVANREREHPQKIYEFGFLSN